ncbi:MAG TPA: DUF2332 domain-containing protein, partial [Acidimicrobiales bacterium]|nr:DUF2332 domain-containing protein [Acidimicrobiales bacterium]
MAEPVAEPSAEPSPDELPLADQFRQFAAAVERDGAVTYAAICRGVAEDPELLALMEQAPLAQRRPNLLLAAVHFLLLGGVAHPLAAHYDTVRLVTGTTRAPPPPGADPVAELVADFRDFCLTKRAELLPLIAVRSTQTNEVGRCAALLPALCAIAASYGESQPISLLDLGTSAGLNLLFDRYAYTYRQRADGAVLEAGADGSPVRLDCTVRGELAALPPLRPPPVAARAGLDRQPIDPDSEDAARWLLACQWPDNLPRFIRLRAALAIARTTTGRPAIFEGDLVDDLDAVAATIDDSRPLVVFHSWVAAYLS